MYFNLQSLLVVAASGVFMASAVELRGRATPRNLQAREICGGRGVCTNGASCVDDTCVCGIGYIPDPTISPISDAGLFSCLPKNECLPVSPCAAANSVCSDEFPPALFKCACMNGERCFVLVVATFADNLRCFVLLLAYLIVERSPNTCSYSSNMPVVPCNRQSNSCPAFKPTCSPHDYIAPAPTTFPSNRFHRCVG